MKPTTEIVLGLRHVGDSESELKIESMTVEQALNSIVDFVLENSMKQRFQIVLSRSEEDTRIGLMSGNSNPIKERRKLYANRIADRIADKIATTTFED